MMIDMIVDHPYDEYNSTHLFYFTPSILYLYQTLIKVSTCLFQVNVMVFNMIIGTPYDEYNNTHLLFCTFHFVIILKMNKGNTSYQ